MKRTILFFSVLVLVLDSCKIAQTTALPLKTTHPFPEDWIGTYRGTLQLVNAEQGTHMELPMTVSISTTDTVNRWRWYSKAIYKGKDIVKDYALFRTDSMPANHYLMDENNGIYLDRILLDDAFYDYFEVGGMGLYGITRKVGDDLHFEIASFALGSKTYSFYKGNEFDVDTITSYKVVNTQKVLLKRVQE